jgi:signal transduction histidine kinase
MSNEVLAGVVGAWSVTHAALGIYFLLAFVLGRRERELWLFSILCFAFSLSSLGEALDYLDGTTLAHAHADMIEHAGYITGAAVNVHFALAFGRVRQRRRVLFVLYAVAALFEIVNFSGGLWVDRHTLTTTVLGATAHYSIGTPSRLCELLYAVGLFETLVTSSLLLRAYVFGRKEALSALIGAGIIVPAAANDVGLASGWFTHTLPLLPHAFLLYAFSVASALLLRYRIAKGALESAASSLRERTEELKHSHAELRQIQDELSNKRQLAVVGELAAAIAHEVRNPLAVIVNAVAGLRRGSLRPEDKTTLLDIVEEEAGRLNRLVGDLLRFARPFAISRQQVSLVEMVNRFNDDDEGQAVQVQVTGEPEAEMVWVDPNLFRLVFDNLISNARQSMRDGGKVEVRFRRDDRPGVPCVRVELEDKGHGMSPDVRRRALDPFYTTRPSGTGLGLPIVQRIVEAHGGWLAIESTEAVGTTVTLHFPVAAPAAVAHGAPASIAS